MGSLLLQLVCRTYLAFWQEKCVITNTTMQKVKRARLLAGVDAGGAAEADPGGAHDAALEQYGFQHALLRAKHPHKVLPCTQQKWCSDRRFPLMTVSGHSFTLTFTLILHASIKKLLWPGLASSPLCQHR